MKKNDKIELTIEDLSADGAGVGKVGGMTFFVKDALIGDTVRAKIMKLKKTYGYARLEEICRPSPYRIQPKCPLHRQCGGCQIQALSYEKQLEYKQNKIKNNLQRIGGFAPEEIPMEPIIGMAHPFSYRNKAQFPVGRDKNGKLAAGFYAAHTHDMIPVENCCLGVPVNQAVMDRVLAWMEQTGTEPYDEKTGRGLVRHVLVRYGFRTGQLMVCLVINGKSLPNAEKLADSLQEIRGMASLSVSINKERNNVIMGNHIQTLWGKDAIEDLIGNIRFQISPLSFYQVNPVQTEVLYQKVMEYAGLTGNEIVWDLYCGIGTISLFLAQKAKKVYGIEIIPQAVADARRNAERNGIRNAVFLNGDAQDVLEQLRREEKIETGEIDGNASKEAREDGLLQPQVVVVDPPRKGCGEKLLETIVEVGAKRVVYVSCDSATLARDLRYLCERGYVMERVQGVDQFCQTVHTETVVQLSLKKNAPKIEIIMTPDEESIYTPAEKATYGKIKAYVKETHGLNVSSLYIAQIKGKCGLDKRDNYNLSKSEDAKVPVCPPEKEDAIMDAFRHFGMV